MDSIRVQNLRSLVDTGDIELKPITLLVGQNDSGRVRFFAHFLCFARVSSLAFR